MVASHARQPSPELRRRIFEIEHLAAMPQVVWQLLEALNDERTTGDDLEKLIERDMAIATKLLSLANSAYYRRANKVTTIKDAVIVLGFDELRILALGVGLAGIFNLKKSPPGFDGEELWIHCMSVSWMANALAKEADYPSPLEVSVAGLLHDLGKLVLSTQLRDELKSILELVEKGEPYFQAEERLGLPHALIGYLLSKSWGLPDLQSAVIRDHHDPDASSPFFKPTCLVYWANELTKRLGYGMCHDARLIDETAVLVGSGLTVQTIKKVAMQAKKTIPGLQETWCRMVVN